MTTPAKNLATAPLNESRAVLLVSADAALAQQLSSALAGNGRTNPANNAERYQVHVATGVAQAKSRTAQIAPRVILLDESAARPGHLEFVVRDLIRFAPVVVLAGSETFARLESLPSLRELVSAGELDFVSRTGALLPLTLSLLERHVRRGGVFAGRPFVLRKEASAASAKQPHQRRGITESDLHNLFEAPGDFGASLRHEVNNPLTGILGNAELLLSRRERLPADAIERLETITILAIRLRETVRRLSDTWEAMSPVVPGQASGHAPAHVRTPLT